MIVAGYIAAIVISIGAASKFIMIGPWVVSGATLVWPLTFVFNDIFTEVYGYKKSRKIIWAGLSVQAGTAFVYWLVGAIPGAPFWHEQVSYNAILGQAPRIVLAGLLAYLAGEYVNSIAVSKLKFMHNGKTGIHQCYRFVGSTALGEFVDTIIFFPASFLGVVPLADLLQAMLTIYIAKVLYEILALPISTWFADYVKAQEGIDVIDNPHTTNYGLFCK